MKERGIEILEQQEKQLSEEEAREFYAHKQDEVNNSNTLIHSFSLQTQ